MSNNNRFHLFHFKPRKLQEERVFIEKTFKNSERNVLAKRSKFNLPKLLESIRKVNMNDLADLMKTLRKMDILLLIYEYPFNNETNETKKKINKILGELYISTVGRTAWELFQQDVEDPFLHELLQLSYKKESSSFLGIETEFLEPFADAFSAKAGIIKGLLPFLQDTKMNTRQVLKKWKVKDASVLENKLMTDLLVHSLTEDYIVRRDGVESITNFLKSISSKDYKKLLKVYIEARNYKQYHHQIMEQAIRRLMDPREQEEEWGFISAKALEQVKKWLYSNELKKFFDSDINSQRFEYWKRYIDYMENVIPLKMPMVAFIYFADFVVVEFGEMGAAYFYHRKGFETLILPRTNNYKFRNTISKATKERMLKDTSEEMNGMPLFITKLDHRGGWQRRFDIYMSKYDYLRDY